MRTPWATAWAKVKSKSEDSVSYRASLSTGTRSGGQSASAKHRYQNRQDIYLVGREGVRDDLVAQGSGNLPAFAQGDAGAFWLAVDSFERKNARLFVELQLNLPAELTLEQQKVAVQSYMSELCDKEKLAYSWVIHHGKGENPHAHVMISEQKNDSINRPAEQHFMRWNSKHPERGGAQKSTALKPKQWLLDARGAWAMTANDALEKAGFKRHFDHRTLKEQRVSALLAKDWRKAAELDREVGEHEGWRVAALRRKHEAGELDELPEYAKDVIESNNSIQNINDAHLKMVTSMTDAQLEHWEREAYFVALAEREPERLGVEIEQLHSEALELDALHDAHSEALELDALHDAHSEALELDTLHDAHSEALELDALHDAHSEALELDALHDAHSEALELDALHDAHSEALEIDALHDAHSEALEIDAHSEALEIDALHDAHSEALEFADVVRSIEKIDLSIENQRERHSIYSLRAEHIKNDYQTLKRQQNALTANEANQNMPVKIFNKILKGLGFKSDSELLEPELERLSRSFSNAKSEREQAQSQLASLKKQRAELMSLDVSEPLREAVRLRRAANASAAEDYRFARKSLTAATLDLDKSFRNYAERDLQMIQQDLNKNDYTLEDMQSVQQQLEEFVDSIDAQLQKQAARQQDSQRPQSQPQPQENQRPGPRMG
ncbi:MAG: MobA/MobL family protein [Gammaproteobacteria bacterium]|nr:MobA/MobL family protein [Gammaproteobacteria bacterium]